MRNLVGIDEAGRGPLAGPIAFGICVVLDSKNILKIIKAGPSKLSDSKKLTKTNREKWFKYLQDLQKQKKIIFKVIFSSASVIDKKGLSYVLKTGVSCALSKAGVSFSDEVFLDGSLSAPEEFKLQKTVIKGDEKIPVISFASIVAKVSRDKLMERVHVKYPKYNFVSHKGYGTKEHYKNIKKFGLIEGVHRKSFLKNIK